jgi:hypothetical protein
MSKRVGTCEFCGRENVHINSEHVWPQWIGNIIIPKMPRAYLRIHGGRAPIKEPHRITRLNVTTHCACQKHCNSGWMSELESDALLFMAPMIDRGALAHLNRERQRTLVAWALKTAMVYEFANTRRTHYFTREERQQLKMWLSPPDSVWIWVGRAEMPSQAYGQPIYRAQPNLARPPLYALTFTAGQFLMQVLAYRPHEGGEAVPRIAPGPFAEALIQLWPSPDTEIIQWPPAGSVTTDEIGALERRFIAQ